MGMQCYLTTVSPLKFLQRVRPTCSKETVDDTKGIVSPYYLWSSSEPQQPAAE
jgi:hypothetical protein